MVEIMVLYYGIGNRILLFETLFYQWINKNSPKIGNNLHAAINHWIRTNLDPYDKICLNYLKKDVTNFEVRITSVAESMHSSMKCHFDGARASFGSQKAAETMLDKAKRKHIETKRSNAKI